MPGSEEREVVLEKQTNKQTKKQTKQTNKQKKPNQKKKKKNQNKNNNKQTNKEILQDRQLPISLQKQVMDQCVLPIMTYGCQTWSLKKPFTN